MKTDERTKICLRELVAQHGAAVYADALRCEAFLRDMCPDSRREINVLAGAVREGVPEDLLNSSRGEPIGLLVERLARRLSDNLAFDADAAHWAVEAWASTFGLTTEAAAPAPVALTPDPVSVVGTNEGPAQATAKSSSTVASSRKKSHAVAWAISLTAIASVVVAVIIGVNVKHASDIHARETRQILSGPQAVRAYIDAETVLDSVKALPYARYATDELQLAGSALEDVNRRLCDAEYDSAAKYADMAAVQARYAASLALTRYLASAQEPDTEFSRPLRVKASVGK